VFIQLGQLFYFQVHKFESCENNNIDNESIVEGAFFFITANLKII